LAWVAEEPSGALDVERMSYVNAYRRRFDHHPSSLGVPPGAAEGGWRVTLGFSPGPLGSWERPRPSARSCRPQSG